MGDYQQRQQRQQHASSRHKIQSHHSSGHALMPSPSLCANCCDCEAVTASVTVSDTESQNICVHSSLLNAHRESQVIQSLLLKSTCMCLRLIRHHSSHIGVSQSQTVISIERGERWKGVRGSRGSTFMPGLCAAVRVVLDYWYLKLILNVPVRGFADVV